MQFMYHLMVGGGAGCALVFWFFGFWFLLVSGSPANNFVTSEASSTGRQYHKQQNNCNTPGRMHWRSSKRAQVLATH